MSIFVLRDSGNYGGYNLREYNTITEALADIRKDGLPNINEYKFIEGKELEFTLKEKEN